MARNAVELVFHGIKVLVDEEDVDRISSMKWHSRKVGYTRYVTHTTGSKSRGDYLKIPIHRFILGVTDKNLVVDHINGNGLDNRKENLRICTQAQNLSNKRMQRNNTSGYKGVTWHKKLGKWMAQIGSRENHRYLGVFETKEAAYLAYCEAAKKQFGEFAKIL